GVNPLLVALNEFVVGRQLPPPGALDQNLLRYLRQSGGALSLSVRLRCIAPDWFGHNRHTRRFRFARPAHRPAWRDTQSKMPVFPIPATTAGYAGSCEQDRGNSSSRPTIPPAHHTC